MNNTRSALIKFIIVTLILSSHFCVFAQTTLYSQYHLSPMQTNPAMLGSYNQPFAMLSYRQLSLGSGLPSSNAAFETPMISVAYPLKSKHLGRFGGTGFSIVNDRAGGGGLLQTTGLQAGFAYNRQLGKTNFLSLGIQGGYFWQNINPAKLTTGSQWVDGQFLSTVDNNEVVGVEPVSYPTASAGLFWYFTDSDSTSGNNANIKAFLGLSGQNLNQPNTAFNIDQSSKLPINLVVTGGITVFDNQIVKVMPNIRWIEQVGFNRQINAGALTWYRFNNGTEEKPHTKIGVGAWYNTNGLANVSFELHQPHYMIALGYAFAATAKAPRLNAFEIKLGIKIGKSYTKNTFRPRPKPVEKVEEKKKEEEKVIPPVAPAPTPEEKEKHLEVLSRPVYFEYKKNFLINPAKSLLNEMVNVLKKYPEIKLNIQGHTCNISQSEDKNQRLSEDRAKTVMEYLIKHGIGAKRLKTSGFGSLSPAYSNDDAYGRIRNRRVEMKIIQ